MSKTAPRTPYNYNGTQTTSHNVSTLLTAAMGRLGAACHGRSDLILAAWPEVIGAQLAAMTQATAYAEGVLTVKVKNSTLHSLLSRHDKHRVLAALQQKFPNANIQNIVFRIG